MGNARSSNHYPHVSPWGGRSRSQVSYFSTIALLVLVKSMPQGAVAQQTNSTLQVDQLQPCSNTSLGLSLLGPDIPVRPCIIYDIKPPDNVLNTRYTQVTLVQVTPTICRDNRDGVFLGVMSLNNDNNGTGVAIGFNEDYTIQFRLISIIAGSSENLNETDYEKKHVELLQSLLEIYQPQYIVGTCSWKAALEPSIALQHKTILLAQVGPPGFYKSDNPYLFGFHIDSDNYPLAAVQILGFYADTQKGGKAKQPVKVLYRNTAEFFNSTCVSAINEAKSVGFDDVDAIEFDPNGDDDNDGVINSVDTDFLIGLADKACPPGSEQSQLNPAIFVCTITEQDVLLERWRQNGCRPTFMWMTAATWAWADANLQAVPFFTGSGQWHEAFDYSDKYFGSGRTLLDYGEKVLGYKGTYDLVASYSMATLFSLHIQSSYRAADDPSVDVDFASDSGYEFLRRQLLILTVDTLFGPFSLNKFQRNVGRGAAGSQWLPISSSMNATDVFQNTCVSPLTQAKAATVVPAKSAISCSAGQYVSFDTIQTEAALLLSKCRVCSVGSFTAVENEELQCTLCSQGSSTENEEGATSCIAQNPHLLSTSVKVFGYVLVAITWSLSLFFLVWLVKNRKDPVVRIGQIQFLMLICSGAIISSSSIVALSVDAGVGDDTTAATMACMSIPFLYTVGWVLQYASLFAKSYRLYQLTSSGFSKVTISALSMYKLIAGVLVCDLVIVVLWTVLAPLQYQRVVVGTDIQNGLITVESFGQCQSSSSSTSAWAFVGPLLALHFALIVGTNILLWKNRGVEDRYQEQKYVAVASIYVGEILVIGLPVLFSVGESTVARFIVLAMIIFLNDAGILCFIFIPKMMYVRQGLPDGVTVGESVIRETMQRAIHRENSLPKHEQPNCVRVATYTGQGMSSSESTDWKRGMSAKLKTISDGLTSSDRTEPE